MNEMLLDQLPVLVEMQRYLEQLSMMEPPAVKKELLLEQVHNYSVLTPRNKEKRRQLFNEDTVRSNVERLCPSIADA